MPFTPTGETVNVTIELVPGAPGTGSCGIVISPIFAAADPATPGIPRYQNFVPPPDFLTRTVHFFADPTVGMVQTRWSYLNRDYNFLTEVEAMLLDDTVLAAPRAQLQCGRGL